VEAVTVISETAVRLSAPLFILFSLELLFAGHNNPGGGFIGGVVISSTFALITVVFGRTDMWVKREVSLDFRKVAVGLGLGMAVFFALFPLLIGWPVMESLVAVWHLGPLEIEAVSSAGFDTGVFFVVFGSLLYILGMIHDAGEEMEDHHMGDGKVDREDMLSMGHAHVDDDTTEGASGDDAGTSDKGESKGVQSTSMMDEDTGDDEEVADDGVTGGTEVDT